jgi:hypothetical protein
MTLSWTIDTFSCPTGIFCPGQQLIETSASGSEIIPLSADYSSCSTSAVGSGPTVAPVGIGAPDIVFILPNDANTCPVLFYPGVGAFWYQGDITTPDGSFPVVPAVTFCRWILPVHIRLISPLTLPDWVPFATVHSKVCPTVMGSAMPIIHGRLAAN